MMNNNEVKEKIYIGDSEMIWMLDSDDDDCRQEACEAAAAEGGGSDGSAKKNTSGVIESHTSTDVPLPATPKTTTKTEDDNAEDQRAQILALHKSFLPADTATVTPMKIETQNETSIKVETATATTVVQKERTSTTSGTGITATASDNIATTITTSSSSESGNRRRPSRRARIDAERKIAAAAAAEENYTNTTDEEKENGEEKEEDAVYDDNGDYGVVGEDCFDPDDATLATSILPVVNTTTPNKKKRKQETPKPPPPLSLSSSKDAVLKLESNSTGTIKAEDNNKGAVKQEENAIEPVQKKSKTKRSRVSEAIVKDASGKLYAKLIEEYKDGNTEVPMDMLAASITSKAGKPYTNPKSDAIQEGMKRLKMEGKAEKVAGRGGKGNCGVARLLPAEIDKIPKEKISHDPEKAMKGLYDRFLWKLGQVPKGGTSVAIQTAAAIVWNKLLDGNAYTRKELVGGTDYSGTNSSGFEAIMKALTLLNFVEGKPKCSFTVKVKRYSIPVSISKQSTE